MLSAGKIGTVGIGLPPITPKVGAQAGSETDLAGSGLEDDDQLLLEAGLRQVGAQEQPAFSEVVFGAAALSAQRPRLTFLRQHTAKPSITITQPIIPLKTRLADGAVLLHQKLFGLAIQADLWLVPLAPQLPNFPAIAPAFLSQLLFVPGASMIGTAKVRTNPLEPLRSTYRGELLRISDSMCLELLAETGNNFYLDIIPDAISEMSILLESLAMQLGDFSRNLTGEAKAAALADAGWLSLFSLLALSIAEGAGKNSDSDDYQSEVSSRLQSALSLLSEAAEIFNAQPTTHTQFQLMANLGLAIAQAQSDLTRAGGRTMTRFVERFGTPSIEFLEDLIPVPIPRPLLAHFITKSAAAITGIVRHQSDLSAITHLSGAPVGAQQTDTQRLLLDTTRKFYLFAQQIYDQHQNKASARRYSSRIAGNLATIDIERATLASPPTESEARAALRRRKNELVSNLNHIVLQFKSEDPALSKQHLDSISEDEIHRTEVELMAQIEDYQDIIKAEDKLGLQKDAIESRFHLAQARYFLALCRLWHNQNPSSAHGELQEVITVTNEILLEKDLLDDELVSAIYVLRALAYMLGQAPQEDTTAAVSEATTFSYKILGWVGIKETDALADYLNSISQSPLALTKPDWAQISTAFPNPVKPTKPAMRN